MSLPIVMTMRPTYAQIIGLQTAYPDLFTLLIGAVTMGVRPVTTDTGTDYPLYQLAVDMIPDGTVDALVVSGMQIDVRGGYWIEVPNSALDNLVDVDWPEPRELSTVDGEDGDRRQLQEYTSVIQGVENSLVRCGYMLNGSSSFVAGNVDTPEIIALYRAKWPDSELYFLVSKDDWIAANVGG